MLWYMISSRGATLSQGHICQGVVTETWIWASVGWPIKPRAIRSLAAAMPALQRICWLTAALRPACCAASRDRLGIRQLLGQRLLAEQMLAGAKRTLGDRALLCGRHGDVDDRDALVGQQRVERFVDCRDAVIGGSLARGRGIDVVAGQHAQVMGA